MAVPVTSYLIGGTTGGAAYGLELNDGINYSVPYADNHLDDLNSVQQEFLYLGGGAVPVAGGVTVQEGSFTLNINVIASNKETWETRLAALKTAFATDRVPPIHLYRKKPSEAAHKYLLVYPREFSADISTRRVSVTLKTLDRRWKTIAKKQYNFHLFEGLEYEDQIIVNNGSVAVEPLLEFVVAEAPSEGINAIYRRAVRIWASRGEQVRNEAILLGGWDQTADITAGKLRADSLDIDVIRADKKVSVNRIVTGAAATRKIWISDTKFTNTVTGQNGETRPIPEFRVSTSIGTAAGVGAVGSILYLNAVPGSLGYQGSDNDERWPTEFQAVIYGELFLLELTSSYYNLTPKLSVNANQVIVVIKARGQNAVNRAFIPANTPLQFPSDYYITYGYGAGLEHNVYESNNFADFPPLVFDSSDNSTWVFDNNLVGQGWGHQSRNWGVATTRWNQNIPPGQRVEVWGSEYLEGVPGLGRQRWAIVGHQYPNVQPNHHYSMRLHFGHWPRKPSQVKYTWKGYKEDVEIQFMTGQNIGTAQERLQIDWNAWALTAGQAAGTQYATGWINTQSNNIGGLATTDLVVMANKFAAGLYNPTIQTLLTIQQIEYNMNESLQLRGATGELVLIPDSILVEGIQAEQGPATGVHPIIVYIQNLTDTNPNPITIQLNAPVGHYFSVDTYTKGYSGISLYALGDTIKRPDWLRILPGSNQIRFSTVLGGAEFDAALSFYEKT